MKRIAYFVVIILSLIAINNLLRSSISLWQKNDVLVRAQRQLDKEKKDHAELEKQLAVVQNPNFMEEEARNKLLLGKPGEQIVLVPTPSITPVPQSKVSHESNVTQWKKLFLL
jgi:cell division protein FtsB